MNTDSSYLSIPVHTLIQSLHQDQRNIPQNSEKLRTEWCQRGHQEAVPQLGLVHWYMHGVNSDPKRFKVHTYIHRYILTYLHTYIRTYIHTYIHLFSLLCFAICTWFHNIHSKLMIDLFNMCTYYFIFMSWMWKFDLDLFRFGIPSQIQELKSKNQKSVDCKLRINTTFWQKIKAKPTISMTAFPSYAVLATHLATLATSTKSSCIQTSPSTLSKWLGSYFWVSKAPPFLWNC